MLTSKIVSRCVWKRGVGVSRSFTTTESNLTNLKGFQLIPDFISVEEENSLLLEVDKQLERRRYQKGHWDQVIQGYREIEKSVWNDPKNQAVFVRMKNLFAPSIEWLPSMHVLDLSPSGYIDPHVDSVKFSGDYIVGISLLSESTLKLQSTSNKDELYQVILPPRSLYVMSFSSRYDFTHAIYNLKGRRISIIIRDVLNSVNSSNVEDPFAVKM